MAEIDCMDFLGYYSLVVVGLIIYFYMNAQIADKYLSAKSSRFEWIMSFLFGVPFLMAAAIPAAIKGIFYKKE